MNRQSRIFLVIFAAFAGILLGNTVCSAEDAAKPAAGETWKIGVIMPLSGDLASFGKNVLRAVELRVERINAEGGISGRKVELFTENDEGVNMKTGEAFRKLAGVNNVHAVIGPLTSGQTLFINRDADKKQVPLVTPTATNDDVTKNCKYVFRACFTDSFQGVAVAKYAINDAKIKTTIAMQDTTSDYSVGVCKNFSATFTQLGGKALPTLSYKKKDTDFTAQLRQVRDLGAESLFIPGYPPELPLIITQTRKMGIKVQLLGVDGWDNEDVVASAGADLNGSVFSAAFSPDATRPALQKFLEIAKAKGIANPGTFEALGYDTTGLVLEAMRQVKSSGDLKSVRSEIRDKLASLKNYDGATGQISMKPNGDPLKSLVMLRYEAAPDGKVKKVFLKSVEP